MAKQSKKEKELIDILDCLYIRSGKEYTLEEFRKYGKRMISSYTASEIHKVQEEVLEEVEYGFDIMVERIQWFCNYIDIIKKGKEELFYRRVGKEFKKFKKQLKIK